MAAPFPEQRSRRQARHRSTLTFGNDGLLDLYIGVIAVTIALMFDVWSIFSSSVAFASALVTSVATVSHLIVEHSRASAIANGRGRLSLKVPAMPRWATWSLYALLPLSLLLAVARLAGLGSAPGIDGAASPGERWWSLLGTIVGPLIVLRVLWRFRLRRHAVAGLVAFAGALLGPALGLDWRDAVALATAVLGGAFLAGGWWTLRAHNRVAVGPSFPGS